jgi:hypothetical protein
MSGRPLTLAEVNEMFALDWAELMTNENYERLLEAGDQIPLADRQLLKNPPVEKMVMMRILSTLKHELNGGLKGLKGLKGFKAGSRRRRRGGADREAAAFWADMDAHRQPVPPPRQPKDRRGLPPKHPGFGKQTRRDVSRGIAHKGRGRKSLKKRR